MENFLGADYRSLDRTGVPGGHAPGPTPRFLARKSLNTSRKAPLIGQNAEIVPITTDSPSFRNSLYTVFPASGSISSENICGNA